MPQRRSPPVGTDEGKQTMDICEEIQTARSAGFVRCCIAPGVATLEQLAADSGLSTGSQLYHEIRADAARRLAFLILTKDLAYDCVVVAPALADSLLERFFAVFGSHDVRYFTNGTFHEAPAENPTHSGVTWQPATAATFDTGILIVGPIASGVLWVEDED